MARNNETAGKNEILKYQDFLQNLCEISFPQQAQKHRNFVQFLLET